MLTTEALKQNEALSSLSDEALQAIAKMSENDETQVVGALRQGYEKDVFEISGVSKDKDEDSSSYIKRILGDYKTKSGASPELQKNLDSAKAKITELEEKLKSGSGDEVLKKQLSDANAQLEATRKQIEDDKQKYQSEKEGYEKRFRDIQIKNAFSVATAGLQFKKEFSEGLRKALISQAYNEMLAFGDVEIQEDGTIVFRDKDGKLKMNPKTNNMPFTMKEVVMETSLKDALMAGKSQTGGGTSGNGAGGTGGGADDLDASEWKTQVEADEAIKKYLLKQGLAVTNPEFQKKFTEIRKEKEVSKLRMQ